MAEDFEARQRGLLRRARWLAAVARAAQAPIGRSPKELVWTRNKSRLYRYVPRGTPRYPIPLLLVYSLINRPHVLDLQPGASLVEYLLDRGFAVYLLDWGEWGPEDRRVTLDDLVLEYLPRAARRTLRDAGAPALSLLGYCMGGTLMLIWAALHPEAPVRNLICLAAPVDFAQAGLFSLWLQPEHFDVDAIVDTLGNVPPGIVDFGARMLRPLGTLGTYVKLWDRVMDDAYVQSWQAMNRWVNEGVPFPGEAFRQWVKEFYRANKLAGGELTIGGRRVDLRDVRASILSISAEVDDITPFESTNVVLDLVGSADRTGLALPGGHVSMVVGRSARTSLWPQLADWLAARSGAV
jgi:polyhydroxyalkanoate synthase